MERYPGRSEGHRWARWSRKGLSIFMWNIQGAREKPNTEQYPRQKGFVLLP